MVLVTDRERPVILSVFFFFQIKPKCSWVFDFHSNRLLIDTAMVVLFLLHSDEYSLIFNLPRLV